MDNKIPELGKIELNPIGYVTTDAKTLPRHWSLSDVEGFLHIDKKYLEALGNIKAGEKIVVLFHFDRSPAFEQRHLRQSPPHRGESLGMFSTCSPVRPNPIGLSVVEVLDINENIIHVKGIDMLDGTPVIDIKPHIVDADSCPSYRGEGTRSKQ